MRIDIPSTWLQCEWTDLSWFPSVRVASNGKHVVLKESRGGYLVALILLIFSAGVWFCGTAFTTIPQWFLTILVVMLAFGAILSPIAVTVIVRLFGTQLTADPTTQVVELRSAMNTCTLPFDSVIAFQYLTESNSAQINLAYRADDDSVTRTCLYAHANAKYVLAIARNFAPLVRWPVVNSDGESVG